MSERLGLLFQDGSILVFPDGTDLITVQQEAEEHDGHGPRTTRVAEIKIEILKELEQASD
jgi:hypothetical protein